MKINATDMHFADLNKLVKGCTDEKIELSDVIGQRYIGAGSSGKEIIINGIPGNALGAYLDGSVIKVNGSVQDATGDTMNKGAIIIHGSTGDAAGYAMRGGKIYVKGNSGYRTGIHMKAYKENQPVIVIGGKAGNFLGEYQAGGYLVVLGLNSDGVTVGSHCGTGMHGGKIFIRGDYVPADLPVQVICSVATKEETDLIKGYVKEFYETFGLEGYNENDKYHVLTPNSKNPYKQLYTAN